MSGQEAVATTDANPRAPGPRAPAPNQSDTERDTPILSLLSPDPDTIMRAQLLVYILPDAC